MAVDGATEDPDNYTMDAATGVISFLPGHIPGSGSR
jgi:hypothetical protein